MRQSWQTEAEEHLKNGRHKRIWNKVVRTLACIVVFCTTYALILPAITMERRTYCGLEAHVHDGNCGSESISWSCEEQWQPHAHRAACFDAEGNLVCGEAEMLLHTHNTYCYNEDGALVCPLTATAEHVHGDGCYTVVRGELLCELEEDPGHSHTDDCYDEAGELICGETAREGHIHGDECFVCTKELRCTRDEVVEHEHTEDCYAADGTLLCAIPAAQRHDHDESCLCTVTAEECDIPEHTHTLACYSDPEADVETVSDWRSSVASADLGGTAAERLLAVAETQLGYRESTKNYTVLADGETTRGYTRYGAWYGDPYGDWCAMFVSFCLHYADVETLGRDASCGSWMADLATDGLVSAAGSAVPAPGDLVFIDTDGDRAADHMGIVTGWADGTLTTIEGNRFDSVCRMSYDTDDETLLGYASLGDAEESGAVQQIIALIDALPTAEEMAESVEDADEAYIEEMSLRAKTVYAAYEELSAEQQALVTNAEKLMELTWLWEAATLDLQSDLTVYQVNQYSQAVTTLVYGGSVRSKLGSGMGFVYWDAIVVEKNSSGTLYVSQYVTDDVSKLDLKATTSGGFVLLLYKASVSASVGSVVTVNFNYSSTTGYNASGYGTVSFSTGTTATEKPAKDNSSNLTVVEGADTRGLIDVNLYDYGTKINTRYNADKNYPGFQQGKGSTSVSTLSSSASFNYGDNITADLAAGQNNVTKNGGINTTTSGANRPISGALQGTLGSDGYPALADGTSLSYLFSNSESDSVTRQNRESVNGLFQYDEQTGEYSFNSRENHAQYNQEDDTFTLYEQLISPNFMMYPFGNFMPFNDIVQASAQTSTIDRDYLLSIASSAEYKAEHQVGDATQNTAYGTLAVNLRTFISLMDTKYGENWTAADCATAYFSAAKLNKTFTLAELQNIYTIDYDEATDFFFGMEMKMQFVQPKGGMTGKDTNQDGTPDHAMRFYFTGDDDVWVYIDGVLFLDLSGIHRHVGGEIDFVNGKVYYYELDTSTGEVSNEPYATKTFAEILTAAGKSTGGLNANGTFADYTSHSFNFYYMERGAGSGVCRMNFNFPLLRENSISVSKELSNNEGVLGDPDFRFRILKEDGTLFISEGTAYHLYGADKQEIGTFGDYKTGSGGVFTLKAGQTALFPDIKESGGKYYVQELLDQEIYQQYGEIRVSGSTVTKTDENVTVDDCTFVGLNSPVEDISTGSTVFRFNNQIDRGKLGSLSVTKVLKEGLQTIGSKPFDFTVTLDGQPLPVGTAYTVGEETRTVTEAGVISLDAGETALIGNILAGSKLVVTETEESATGYTVTYQLNGVTMSGEAKGVIALGPTAVSAVTVTNAIGGDTVTIPVEKTLVNPDGQARTYTFRLVQVTDNTGAVEVEGTEQTASVTFGAGDTTTLQKTAFTLVYPQADYESSTTLYYKITEVNGSDAETLYDETVWLASVSLQRTDSSLTAAAPILWRSGDGNAGTAASVSFRNVLGVYELPETGGRGSFWFIFCGFCLTAAAVTILCARGRRKERGTE